MIFKNNKNNKYLKLNNLIQDIENKYKFLFF